MEIKNIKSSYELALERIIAPKYPKVEEYDISKPPDYVHIPEFENREDRVLEEDNSNETKLLPELLKEKKKKEEEKASMNEINVQEAQSISYTDILECHFSGSTLSYSGFSKMNRNIVFGLSNRNVRVKLQDISNEVDVNKETQKQLDFFKDADISPSAPKIYSMTVPCDFVHPGRKIAYTMIESSSLHRDYCEKLNMMNEIWVPSVFGQKLLQKSNVNPPSYVMPLGVDIGRYKCDCGTIDFGSATRDFRFLCLAKYSSRKNFTLLLKAYMEEFSGEENISLILVTRPLNVSADRKGLDGLMEDFNAMKQSVRKNEEDLPHIAVYNKPIPEKDMPKVYNSCHAFVLISYGEGFSLTPLEAASCGLPVIASNVTAHTDFLNQDNSFLVEPDNFVEAKVGGNMSNLAKLCHFYNGQSFPYFGVNAMEQTRQHMRNVFENYNDAKVKADKLRKLVISDYTWDKAIDKIYLMLRDIS